MISTMDPLRLKRSESWRNRITLLAAVVTPILIAVVALLLIQQVRTADRLREEELAAQERRALVLTILSSHQDLETGSRGFVISGKETFLEPYYKAVVSLRAAEPRLKAAYAAAPETSRASAEIERLSARKKAFILETIDTMRQGDRPLASSRIAGGEGKRYMDGIRIQVNSLLDFEKRQMANSAMRARNALGMLRDTMFGMLGLLLVLLLLAAYAIRETLGSRNQAILQSHDEAVRRQSILDSTMDGIVTLNPSGSLESTNAATLRMFGYDASELDRRDAGILFAGQPQLGYVAETLRDLDPSDDGATNAPIARELVARRKDGSEFEVEVAISSMMLAEGPRYVAVIRDITERRRVERMKSEFVSTVSHELRTPLTSIAGSLGLLAGGAAGPLGERAERLLTIANNNASRLVRLINDILDIEKIESGKMPFDNCELDLTTELATYVEENRSYASGYGVELNLIAADEPAHVFADRDRLAQVVTNLMSNAVKFSPAGATVDVVLSAGPHWHRISVVDRGSGIPDEFRDRIFGKFAQADSSDARQKGGTGLGLSIVREIVRRLEGTIWFESQPGIGTSFHVDLPAIKGARSPGGTARVLVCADESESALDQVLSEAGYAVDFAPDAVTAARLLESAIFEGIVVDMGLEGGEAIEIIRMVREAQSHAGTPILAIGGQSRCSDTALVLDWLRKPLELERLRESIDTARRQTGSRRLRILHVEDDPDVARLVAESLGSGTEVISIESIFQARAALAEEHFDLALLDLGLADGSGIELLSDLQREGQPPIPVVIFSAQDADPQIAGQVDAYLTKARTPMGSLVGLIEELAARRSQLEKAA
jgi:PAS domain S-box-containing protein